MKLNEITSREIPPNINIGHKTFHHFDSNEEGEIYKSEIGRQFIVIPWYNNKLDIGNARPKGATP